MRVLLDESTGTIDRLIAQVGYGVDQDPAFAADPALLAATVRNTRANVRFWAEAVLDDPAAPVPVNESPQMVGTARDLIRRGLDDVAAENLRRGQNAAWRTWSHIALELTDDREELRELLDYSARSLFGFVDAMNTVIAAGMRAERAQLRAGTHTQRLETVGLIVDGAPITRERAATRLGYDLEAAHLAAVVWLEELRPEAPSLERAAEAVAVAGGATRPLTVTASAGVLWVWVAARTAPDLAQLEQALDAIPLVRVALGRVAPGIDGFRRSHLDAVATQRLLMRASADVRLADWETVRLAALLYEDEPRAQEFVRATLGDLAGADEALRETLRVFLREQSNAARAARKLFTHRNTVLTRVSRAEQLLPRALAETSVDVAVALDLDRWIR